MITLQPTQLQHAYIIKRIASQNLSKCGAKNSNLAQSVPLVGRIAADLTNEGTYLHSYCTNPTLLRNNPENTHNIDTKGKPLNLLKAGHV